MEWPWKLDVLAARLSVWLTLCFIHDAAWQVGLKKGLVRFGWGALGGTACIEEFG